jgi:hypothetical protein
MCMPSLYPCTHTHIHSHTHIHIPAVQVRRPARPQWSGHRQCGLRCHTVIYTYTHTHTHIYTYIHIYTHIPAVQVRRPARPQWSGHRQCGWDPTQWSCGPGCMSPRLSRTWETIAPDSTERERERMLDLCYFWEPCRYDCLVLGGPLHLVTQIIIYIYIYIYIYIHTYIYTYSVHTWMTSSVCQSKPWSFADKLRMSKSATVCQDQDVSRIHICMHVHLCVCVFILHESQNHEPCWQISRVEERHSLSGPRC